MGSIGFRDGIFNSDETETEVASVMLYFHCGVFEKFLSLYWLTFEEKFARHACVSWLCDLFTSKTKSFRGGYFWNTHVLYEINKYI